MMTMHQLLPPGIRKALPLIGSLREGPLAQLPAQAKFFGGSWTWYAMEGAAVLGDGTQVALGAMDLPDDFPEDPAPGEVMDVIFWGFVVSGLGQDCDEWGDFSLRELMQVRFPPFRLPIERDLYWQPGPAPEAQR